MAHVEKDISVVVLILVLVAYRGFSGFRQVQVIFQRRSALKKKKKKKNSKWKITNHQPPKYSVVSTFLAAQGWI